MKKFRNLDQHKNSHEDPLSKTVNWLTKLTARYHDNIRNIPTWLQICNRGPYLNVVRFRSINK